MNSIRRTLAALPRFAVYTALLLALACSWDNKSGTGKSNPVQEGGDDMGNFLQARVVDSLGRPFPTTATVLSDLDTLNVHADSNGSFRLPAKRRSWLRLATSRGMFLWDAPPESGDAGIWKVGRPFVLRGWFQERGTLRIPGVGEALHDSGEFAFPEVPPGRARLTVSSGSRSGSTLIQLAHRVWNVPPPPDTLVVLPALVLDDTTLRRSTPRDSLACGESCRQFYVLNGKFLIDTASLSAKTTTLCRPWSDNSTIPWNGAIAYDTLCDERDGRTYRTVTLGNKVWMAQNLDYAGSSDSAIGRCNGGDPAQCEVYGRLYDWATAMGIEAGYNTSFWIGDGNSWPGICPVGWHLPSRVELDSFWMWVTDQTGEGNQAAAVRSTSGWRVHESGVPKNGTDRFGLRILPAGFSVGTTSNPPGNDANLFGATQDDTDPNRAYGMDFSNLDLSRISSPNKSVEFSVRCVRD